MKFFLQVMLLCLSTAVVAQTQVSGTVTDGSGQPVPGASVVLDSNTGTVTDFDGNFSLTTSKTPPFTLTVSNVGLETKTVTVSSATQSLSITLGENATELDEIVVSASRMAERIFESPVTVEKFSIQQIERTPSSDYFNGLENLRGIQLNQGGLVFNQVSTRGFATMYNEGFVTLVDGMNNQAPVFGFAVGNLVGLNELDVQSIEVLPGAASALYGADAYKGIMFLNSKNPFEHEGVSAYYKTGVTQQDAAGNNEFTDFGIRMATKLGDKWAIKATFSHKEGTEWAATDYRHNVDGKPVNGYNADNPDYNAINQYGEVSVSSSAQWDALYALTQNPLLLNLKAAAPNYFDSVMTTGYNEADLAPSQATNTKGNFAIHFRPNDKSEFILSSLIGTGSSPLQATGRYFIENFKLQQHKIEVRSGGLTARAYLTKENSGNTYQMEAAAIGVANAQPGGILNGWGSAYLQTYLGAAAVANGLTPDLAGISGLLNIIGGDILTGGQSINNLPAFAPLGGNTIFAHKAARLAANANMLVPGSSEYNAALNRMTSNPFEIGSGAVIVDDSQVIDADLIYDFEDSLDFANIIAGATYRSSELNTGGTLYTDYDGPITYYQYGAFVQAKKDLFNDFVSLTASLRYDKAEFFDGYVTPRLGLLFNISDEQNVRVSYQQGLRNPTNQDQYIALDSGQAILLGSSPDSIDRYKQNVQLENNTVALITGDYIFTPGVAKLLNGADANLENVHAEFVRTLDLGYRYNSNGFTFDLSAYYSDYDDYIGATTVIIPVLGAGITDPIAQGNFAIYSVDSNQDEDFKSYGVNISASQALNKNLLVNLVYEFNELDYTRGNDPTFETSWNTPTHRIKAGLNGNFNPVSFNVNARYNSEYMFESTFVDEMIDANTVIDAQVTFDLSKLNAKLRVGGNNIGGNEFVSLAGSGRIGSIYYTSILFDF
ncbi:MAG: TonB-dependent receptor [Bacteroidetes bacterium]|nr:TonB-dependent receptor [Bacteroidota bacterium]